MRKALIVSIVIFVVSVAFVIATATARNGASGSVQAPPPSSLDVLSFTVAVLSLISSVVLGVLQLRRR
jgi:hypothetical protein